MALEGLSPLSWIRSLDAPARVADAISSLATLLSQQPTFSPEQTASLKTYFWQLKRLDQGNQTGIISALRQQFFPFEPVPIDETDIESLALDPRKLCAFIVDNENNRSTLQVVFDYLQNHPDLVGKMDPRFLFVAAANANCISILKRCLEVFSVEELRCHSRVCLDTLFLWGGDVGVKIGDRTFLLHQKILDARAEIPRIKAIIGSEMETEFLLRALYRGSTFISVDNHWHVIDFALTWNVPCMRHDWEQWMLRHLDQIDTLEGLIKVFIIANTFNMEVLLGPTVSAVIHRFVRYDNPAKEGAVLFLTKQGSHVTTYDHTKGYQSGKLTPFVEMLKLLTQYCPNLQTLDCGQPNPPDHVCVRHKLEREVRQFTRQMSDLKLLIGSVSPRSPIAPPPSPLASPRSPLVPSPSPIVPPLSSLMSPRSPLVPPLSSLMSPRSPLVPPLSSLMSPPSPLASPRSPLVPPLSPRNRTRADDAALVALVSECKQLQYLIFPPGYSLTVLPLLAHADKTRRLECLDLSGCRLQAKPLEAWLKWLQPKELILRGCQGMNDEVFEVLSAQKQLEGLDLSDNPDMPVVGLQEFPNLRWLRMQGCSVNHTAAIVSFIGNALRCLAVDVLSDAALKAIVNASPCLEEVRLQPTTWLSADTLSHCIRPQLSYLDLSVAQSLVDLSKKKYNLLKILIVNWLDWFNDALLEQVVTHAGSLFELQAASCTKITNRGLMAIAQHLPFLHTIDLSRTSGSAKGYAEVLRQCRNLRHVNLAGCRVDKETLINHQLETLNLAETALSEVELENVLIFQEKLLELDLSGCNKVTARVLQIIADHVKGLCVLRLRGCSQVRKAWCAPVLQQCQDLRILDVTDIPYFENEAEDDKLYDKMVTCATAQEPAALARAAAAPTRAPDIASSDPSRAASSETPAHP